MKSVSIASLALFAVACGPQDTVIGGTNPACLTNLLGVSTNCQTGTGPAPTPTPSTLKLIVIGDDPSPPPSAYTLNGSVRVTNGTPNSWQALGQNNAPPVTKIIGTPITSVGQCVPFDVKVVVSAPAPMSQQGAFYPSSHGNRFEVCLDGNDVLVKFEDAGGPLTAFNDYQVRVKAQDGSPLNYQWVGGQLFICKD
jgi:hypothetical protein